MAVVKDVTAVVVIGNTMPVAPAAMGTLAGIGAAALSLARLMVRPFAGAGADKLIVPVAEAPPVTLEGETETLVKDTELATTSKAASRL